MKQLARAVGLMAFTWLSASPAAAQVIFSNLGANDSYLPVGIGIGRDPSPVFNYAGAAFTPQGRNYTLSKIELPAELNASPNGTVGPNELDVYLMGDSNGLPSGIIESYQVLNAMQQGHFVLIAINSSKRPLLIAGTRYWLVAAGGPTTFASWAQNSINATGANVSGPTLTSLVRDSDTNVGPAFRLTENIITGVNPASTLAGGPQFTLTVSGSNFPSGATVQWNGTPVATTVISSTQLSAVIPASLIASFGSATISVSGLGSATFTVSAPTLPSLASVTPPNAQAGGPQFTMAVSGTSFLTWTQVRWNGQNLSTTYISASQLSAIVPATLIATPGTASLTVANAANSISNVLSFNISCGYTLTLTSGGVGGSGQSVFPASGGAGIVSVATAPGCPWTASSSVPWVTIALGTSGNSSGQVSYSVAANGGSTRNGNLTIAGQTFVISQPGAQPSIFSQGVTNAASATSGVAAGTWIAIFGSNLATTTRSWGDSDFAGGKLPVLLDGVSVSINGKPAYVYYVSPTQLDVLAPQDAATGPVTVAVLNALGSASASVNKQPVAPGFFALAGPSPRYAIASLPDGTYVGKPELFPGSAARPAKPGDIVSLYLTGLGSTNPQYPDGQIIRLPAPLANGVSVSVGGKPASVDFAGLVEAGVYQINIHIPAVPDGDAAVTVQVQGFDPTDQAFLPIKQ